MTDQAEPGRPPAHDLSAFDLTKRSPEQLAQSFARWKAQRKRPPEAEATRASPPIVAQPSPAIAKDAAPDPSPGNVAPKPASAKRAKPVEYSDTFSALLAAGSEPAVQRAVWTPVAVRPSPKRNGSPGRRLKAMSILAGAASVLALAGGALLELSDWRDSTEAEPKVAQVHPQQFPMAGAIASAATRAPAVEWKLQRTVDLALMKAAPAADAAKPMQPASEPPTVHTASKAATAAPPEPARKKAAPETEQFVVKPFVPSAASSPAVVPAAQGTAAIPASPVAAVARTGDPRPDALFQQSRDKSTGTSGNGTLNNGVASGGKLAAATGSGSAVDTRSATTRTATTRSGKVANGSSGDPRGEVSGGASVGPDTTSASGGDAGDASGGSDTGSGNTGDDGATGGGSASSGADGGDTGSSADTGGSDTGGSDAGGGDTGDSGTGSSDTGSSDTGGDDGGNGAAGDGGSGDGDSSSSDGEDGDSGGIGGAIGGALEGVGDALGDALGGTNGNPDSNDKDQRN